MDSERLEDFRFQTKKEYEEEIKKLIFDLSSSKKGKKREVIEENYEELLEEYLRFCSNA